MLLKAVRFRAGRVRTATNTGWLNRIRERCSLSPPPTTIFDMRLAYADPPYPGRAHLYEGHPDYAGEVDHEELIYRLAHSDTYDGWALSTNASSLREILPLCPGKARVLAWVKHSITVSWEPVIVVSARPVRNVRDWIHVEPEAFQWRPKPDSYVIGQKPTPFCEWLFLWLGAEPGDTLDDLFPGSGAVGDAWDRWSSQPPLAGFPSKRRIRRDRDQMLAAHPTLGDF